MQNTCYFCKMKIKTVIFFTLSVLLCLIAQSCKRFSLYTEKGTPLHYSVLNTITDTMICCPEAALNILISVSDTVDEQGLSKPDYYEYQILIAEALYKNDFSQTNDSAIVESVRFYDSLANIYPKNVDVLFQKSRAHYYKAVGESENNDIKNACAEYLIALKTINQIKENNRTFNIDYFNGLIYNRLASIYYYNDAFNLSISLDKMANECFAKSNSIHPIAYNYLCIAKMLSTMDLYDEEENYLNMADSLISNVLKIEDNQLKRKILMERALLASYRDNDNKKALELARQYMSKADGEEERILGHTQLGEIFYKDCQYDSALYYFEKDFSRNHYTMLHCGNRIIEICKIIGDNEKAAYYAPYLAEETNKELELAPLKAELVAMYEQYEADKHKAEIRQLWINILLILVLLFIALVVVFYMISLFQKKKHIDEISRKDSYIGTLNSKIKKATTDERLRNIKTDELYKKLYSVTQMHIKSSVKYPELVMTDEERMHLTELFDKEFDGALRTVIMKNSRLKKSDELLFCLYMLSLDDKHIAAVTGASYHNVFMRSRKCLEILGGGENLQEAIIKAISKSDII